MTEMTRVRPGLMQRSGTPTTDAEPSRPAGAVPVMRGLAIRRSMSDQEVQQATAKFDAHGNVLLSKDDSHYMIDSRDGADAVKLQEVDPTVGNIPIGEPIRVTVAELKRDYTLVQWVSGGVNHPVKPANVTKPIVGASLLEHEDTPISMTHHTFDLLKTPPPGKGRAAGPNRADNHHLTVENALPAMLATPTDEYPQFFADKDKNTKKEHNQTLNAREFHSIDNLHFVPAPDAQQPTALPLRQAGLRTDARAKDTPKDATAIEQDITLTTFRAYLARAFTALGVDAGLQAAILDVLDRTGAQLGVTADELHLAADQRADFTRLVLLVQKRTGGIDPSHKTPPELEGIIEPVARITLRAVDFGKTQEERARVVGEYKKDLKPATWKRIADDLNAAKKCELLEGKDSSVFNEVLTFLVNRHWPMIKSWTLAPPDAH